jgi:hypothetical protein
VSVANSVADSFVSCNGSVSLGWLVFQFKFTEGFELAVYLMSSLMKSNFLRWIIRFGVSKSNERIVAELRDLYDR